MNTLFYGDNLKVLRDHIRDESVDLIYLDPPFNSNRSYNVLFKDESGVSSDAQITAFDDSWHWGETAQETYEELVRSAPGDVGTMIGALRQFIGTNQMMAYLVMMAARLVELHRVLKPTGSLYLHCDPTASHYLKMILDMTFGVENFVNEIVWKRADAKGDIGQGAKHLGRVNDIILFYAKDADQHIFNPQFSPMSDEYIEKWYRHTDETGRRYKLDNMLGPGGAAKGNPEYEVMGVKRFWRYSKENMEKLIKEGRVIQTKPGAVPMYKRYLDETKGVPWTTNWGDIRPIHGWANEKLGYPTQKPLELLERIIALSSNLGDVVLDPFSGCGTCISAAQKLGRQWIGIDITHLAIAMHKSRLKDMYGLEPGKDYQVIGEPEDLQGARQLAQDDRYQFQWWALSLIEARPQGGSDGGKTGKKGSDRGIDGVINFLDDRKGGVKRAIVQVKSGKVNSGVIRDLKGTIEREGAAIGILITLEPSTREMDIEASTAGKYHSEIWDRDYPRIQILSIEQLLAGAEVKLPQTPSNAAAFKQASKEEPSGPVQGTLDL